MRKTLAVWAIFVKAGWRSLFIQTLPARAKQFRKSEGRNVLVPCRGSKTVVPNLFYAVAHVSLSAERRGPPSQNNRKRYSVFI